MSSDVARQVELDVALQLQRADEVPRALADQHLGAVAAPPPRPSMARWMAAVSSVRAVALGAVVAHVEDADILRR